MCCTWKRVFEWKTPSALHELALRLKRLERFHGNSRRKIDSFCPEFEGGISSAQESSRHRNKITTSSRHPEQRRSPLFDMSDHILAWRTFTFERSHPSVFLFHACIPNCVFVQKCIVNEYQCKVFIFARVPLPGIKYKYGEHSSGQGLTRACFECSVSGSNWISLRSITAICGTDYIAR